MKMNKKKIMMMMIMMMMMTFKTPCLETACRITHCVLIIQGDQKVSVHLMITIQKAGVQRLFDHPVLR
jgi:hypothetical protein